MKCTYRSSHLAIRPEMSQSVAKDKFVHVGNDFERLAKNKKRRHGDENDPQIVFFHLLLGKSSAGPLSHQVFDELPTSVRSSQRASLGLTIWSRCGGCRNDLNNLYL